ncbi:hypothetical protein [Thermomonospora amylolytica]|uniref:hypothetical protein n=1 Tax=Thermomonospora amylolytica TaxID=1411117 RepID=UPI00130079BB|nr:hypothetical protein [Thermomonospora amylolytica]
MPPVPPLVERCVLGVDVKRYSARTTQQQLLMQQDLDRLLGEAAAAAGLDRSVWERQPGGDGEIAELPPGTDLIAVVRRLVLELVPLLADHNDGHTPERRIGLRMAVHLDVSLSGPLGSPGPALVVLNRLLNARPVRDALDASPSGLALIVSATVFDRVVRSGLGGLRPEQFHEVTVDLPDKDFHQTAYVHVPAALTASGWRPGAPGPDPAPGPVPGPGGGPVGGGPGGAPQAPPQPPPPRPAEPASPPEGAQYGGIRIGRQRAERVVFGDYHEAPPPVDHEGLGRRALDAGNYATARTHLASAMESAPDDPALRFRRALALLDGKRPHLHSWPVLDQVIGLLEGARHGLPEAMALWLLVIEDRQQSWRHRTRVPAELVDHVNTLPPQAAAEIVRHITAAENHVWQLLAARSGRNTPR